MIVEIGIRNALKLHECEKKNRSQFTGWRDIYHGSLNSRILDFSVFSGKNREFKFRTLFVGMTFRGFRVQYLKVTKMEAIWQRSKLHGEWKKYLATKPLAKVSNWRPTG